MSNRAFHNVLLPILLLAGLAYGQITPSDDAYTDTAVPTGNFGVKPTAGVSSAAQTSFITFDLSSIPAGTPGASISKATLKLYVNTVVTAGSFNMVFVNGTWSEKTITANLSPALGANIAASVSLDKTQVKDYVLVDITPALKAWLDGTQANDGIALVANSPLAATFDTKENTTNSHPPELDVVFSGGGTITGIKTAAGSGLIGGTNSGVANLSLLTSCSNGQLLAWNGSAWACKTVGGTGTVTSVGLSAPASDFTVTGSPVTSSGTLGLNWTTAPTSANVGNAIVKRDATGSFIVQDMTAQGQILVNNTSLLNPLLSIASRTNAAAIVGSATGGGTTNGVLGTSASSGAGSAGVQGADNNTSPQNYTVGVSGRTANLHGLGVLGTGGTLSNVGKLRLGTAGAGVWADSPNFGLVATSDLNAIVAYNNSTAATIYGENDTTSASGYLLYASAPNVTSNGNPASCTVSTHADLGCTGNLKADGTLRVGQDATQPSTANGLVKAMFYFDPFQPAGSQIVTCFNSQLTGAAASTPPCGFAVTHDGLGHNTFDFGFTVGGRIAQATARGQNGSFVGVSIFNLVASVLEIISFYNGGNATDTPLYVTVF